MIDKIFVYNQILDIYLRSNCLFIFFLRTSTPFYVYLLSLYRYACFVPILRQDYICNLTVYHLDLQNRIYPNVCYAQLKEGSSHFFQDLFGFLKLTIELNNAKVSEFFQKAPK